MRSVIAELESLVPWFHAPTCTLIFGSAVVLALAGPAPAGPPPCRTSWNQLGTAYQFRTKMDRCEGMRGERPISAVGPWLASYSIGEVRGQKRPQGGESFNLLVPAIGSARQMPELKVQARGGEYQMIPLQLGLPRQGWRDFIWSAGLIRREAIHPRELRATAQIHQPGEATQWLPVRFSPATTYSLVIASNAPQPVAYVRILGPGDRPVKECSGPTRLEGELLCQWDGRRQPAGSYRLEVRAATGEAGSLNVSLRHDPSWLSR
jgi:hypothetical protein